MKPCYALLFFLIFFTAEVHAQDLRYFVLCPIDTTSEFELTIHVQYNRKTDAISESMTLNRILRQPFNYLDDSCKKSYLVDYDLQKERFRIITAVRDSFYVVEGVDGISCTHDSLVQYLNLEKVKWLHFFVYNTSAFDTISDRPIDLSRLNSLKHLFLPKLEKLTIDYNEDLPQVRVNLPKWPTYDLLKNSGTLSEVNFVLKCPDRERVLNDLQQIKGLGEVAFYGVKYLKSKHKTQYGYPYLSTNDAIKFPDLRMLYGIDGYSFHHELVTKKLFMVFLDEYSYNQFNSAEKVFFHEQLPGGGLFYINYIDTLIYEKIPELKQKSGLQIILAKDLFTFDWEDNWDDPSDYPVRPGKYFISLNPTDTIAVGNLENGKQLGEWRYYQSISANKPFLTSSHQPIPKVSFPINGGWTYYYPNGSSAIRGNFKNGMKNGIWLFYGPDGELEERQHYKDDQMCGLTTNYIKNNPSGRPERSFYFKNGDFIQLERGSKNEHVYLSVKMSDGHSVWQDEHRNLWKYKDGVTGKCMVYGSKVYNRYTYRKLKKLFPELNRSEIVNGFQNLVIQGL